MCPVLLQLLCLQITHKLLDISYLVSKSGITAPQTLIDPVRNASATLYSAVSKNQETVAIKRGKMSLKGENKLNLSNQIASGLAGQVNNFYWLFPTNLPAGFIGLLLYLQIKQLTLVPVYALSINNFVHLREHLYYLLILSNFNYNHCSYLMRSCSGTACQNSNCILSFSRRWLLEHLVPNPSASLWSENIMERQ